MGERINYIDIRKIVEECVKQAGVYYEELYITPTSSGFKVEVSPTPMFTMLKEVSKCISTKIRADVSIREYPYGSVIIAKIHKTTSA